MAKINYQPINLSTDEFIARAYSGIEEKNRDLNKFSLPKIDKIIINVGVGRFDEKYKQVIGEYIEKLTSQKVNKIPARVSISQFKLRQGQIVGLSTTLRRDKAVDFLMQLIYIALPRTRDFKGVKSSAFDSNYKCYSLGIENTAIFPSIGFDINIPFGMQVNIVFKKGTVLNKQFLQELNFPFKK